jgi:DNA-binding MarR family transcriptional regulator
MVERAPDVTRLIDRLERRGFVERTRVAADRRLSMARITKAGIDLLRKVDPHVHEIQRQLASRVPVRDLRELSRICEAIYGGK